MLNIKNVLLSVSILTSIFTNCSENTKKHTAREYAQDFLKFVAIGGAGTVAYQELNAQGYAASYILGAGMSCVVLGESLSACSNLLKGDQDTASHRIIELGGLVVGSFLGEMLHRQTRTHRG